VGSERWILQKSQTQTEAARSVIKLADSRWKEFADLFDAIIPINNDVFSRILHPPQRHI